MNEVGGLMDIKGWVKWIAPTPVRRFLRSAYWHMLGRDPLPVFRQMARSRRDLEPVGNGPLVSILCCVWNTPPRILGQMIRSIRTQSYENWELIINNCSDSSHPEIEKLLMHHAAEDVRIKVRKKSNLGIALNTNAIASDAAGEFILLMDHDDMLLPDALEQLMKTQQKEDADFVYSDEYYLLMEYHLIWHRHKKPFSMRLLESKNFVNHPALIRKILFFQVGGLRTGFEGSQDYDFYLRLFEKTAKVAYIPAPLYIWRIHPESLSQSSVDNCIVSGKKALLEHFERINVPVIVKSHKNEAVFKVQFLDTSRKRKRPSTRP